MQIILLWITSWEFIDCIRNLKNELNYSLEIIRFLRYLEIAMDACNILINSFEIHINAAADLILF